MPDRTESFAPSFHVRNPSVVTALLKLEDMLADPLYWTTRTYSRALPTTDSYHHYAFCLSGAINRLNIPNRVRNDLHYLMDDVLAGWNSSRFGSIPNFNDHSCTTHADLMMVLATALDIAEQEGI
jgi:hypothetical protein